MKRTRWPVVLVIVAAVIGLLLWFPGRGEVAPSRVLRSPVAASVGDAGGSWYCAARDVGVEAPTHTLVVASVSEQDADLRLDSFGADGPGATTDLELPAGETIEVDVATVLGGANVSVMVESDAPVAVEHRYDFDGGADQAPCSTFSSDTWFFPTVVTTRDALARLSLFNPFPGDASVDIEVAFDTGVRQPTALSGLVIPAGTTRVIELSEEVQRREQFSATIRSRSGGVVAELAQRFDGTGEVPVTGLRLVSGIRKPSAQWSFAGGFADSTAAESVVVLNPEEGKTSLLAQVVPYGGTEVLPEPFEMEVPGLRYGLLDLSSESRVPQFGYHAIDVESSGSRPLVVARSIDVTGAPEAAEADPLRAKMTGGTTASAGASVAARSWVSGAMALSDNVDGAVLVHNRSNAATVATITAVGLDGTELGSTDFELPVGESVAVGAAEMLTEAGSFTARVTSDGPVVVERLLVWTSPADLSLQAAVPVLDSLDGLESLGG